MSRSVIATHNPTAPLVEKAPEYAWFGVGRRFDLLDSGNFWLSETSGPAGTFHSFGGKPGHTQRLDLVSGRAVDPLGRDRHSK